MKTILITGVSSGLGRAMAVEAPGRGHRVVGILRREEQRAKFEGLASGRAIGGLCTFPGLGAYHGTKFAMPVMNDSLVKEVGPLGLRVTAGLPGAYGTDWSCRSLSRSHHQIADHDALLAEKRQFNWGDPAALGKPVLDTIEMREPPAHLLVGSTAVERVRARLDEWRREIDRWTLLSQAGGEG
jgi:NAD(P)-dependent dehydrogenase (short-subunit alcohol dehydrogenase family)